MLNKLFTGVVISTLFVPGVATINAAESTSTNSETGTILVQDKTNIVNNNIDDVKAFDMKEIYSKNSTTNYSSSSSDEYINQLSEELDRLGAKMEETSGLARTDIENQLSNTKAKLQEYLDQNPEIRKELFPKEDTTDMTRSYFPTVDIESVPNWTLHGDILVTNGKGFASSLYVGHAAIADIDKNWYVESCPKGKCSGATDEGVQYRSDYNTVWQKQPSSSWGRFEVRGATKSDYLNSLGFAQARVGLPYNGDFNSSGSGYYCSELVAVAWKRGGEKVVISGSDYEYILPMELVWSSNTYRVEGGL
ncbi:Uncharacterized distant relative of cell wall-associated hydrolases [Turicibacter sanguinis]|nr:Uncharacterized distant relative of cell wall-associated hydrolases [Turicibacter sanguinis]